MAAIFLHDHPDFPDLIRILEEETSTLAGLIEKDYWIMQVLYGLQQQGYAFQLKGGTSLSKGFRVIDRFSEDIDMHITPPAALGINENPNNHNARNAQKKKAYYDQLSTEIAIPGIINIKRDPLFDEPKNYNSGGIRLYYQTTHEVVLDLKEGILIEAGFAAVSPNTPITISSWAYDKAVRQPGLSLIDNRAIQIPCYDMEYTFVEKLQTVATKFRRELETGQAEANYIRQYYDLYCLLGISAIQQFIGTAAYVAYKEKHFPMADQAVPLKLNEAFLLNEPAVREKMEKRYTSKKALYYNGQPLFADILARIHQFIHRL